MKFVSQLTERVIEEARKGTELYHVTNFDSAVKILKTATVLPSSNEGTKKKFYSFGTLPRWEFKGRDVIMVFAWKAVTPHTVPVKYNKDWFNAYPDHAGYIADHHVCRGGGDDLCFDFFMTMDDEGEYVAKVPGKPLRFRLGDVKRVVVRNAAAVEMLRGKLKRVGVSVPIVPLSGGMKLKHPPEDEDLLLLRDPKLAARQEKAFEREVAQYAKRFRRGQESIDDAQIKFEGYLFRLAEKRYNLIPEEQVWDVVAEAWERVESRL